MSSIQGCHSSMVYKDVLISRRLVGIEGFHYIQKCPHFKEIGWSRGVPLYTEVSSFQGCCNRGVW